MKNEKMPNNKVKRRFYTALYSCAGALLVAAAFISAINSKNADNDTAPEVKIENAAGSDAREVNNSTDKSYRQNENAAEPKNTTKGKAADDDLKNTEPAEQNTQNTQTAKTNEESEPESETQSQDVSEKNTNTSNPPKEEKVFSLFDDSKEMSWPVAGKIVMDYSVETAVFDKTLEQYRTNDSICISAPEGTDVKAAAEGVVENIFEDNENGKSIVINHGNGWMTTYSQLENNLLVEVGQVVAEGDVIGKIGEPTNYSVALGAHLDFKLTKDNESTDPKLVLAQYDE